MKKGGTPQPWNTADAKKIINHLAKTANISWTDHAVAQLLERDLIAGDIHNLLRSGYVYQPAKKSTRKGIYKYCIEGRTPNSGRRFIRAVIAATEIPAEIKIITVMWRDEPTARGA